MCTIEDLLHDELLDRHARKRVELVSEDLLLKLIAKSERLLKPSRCVTVELGDPLDDTMAFVRHSHRDLGFVELQLHCKSGLQFLLQATPSVEEELIRR